MKKKLKKSLLWLGIIMILLSTTIVILIILGIIVIPTRAVSGEILNPSFETSSDWDYWEFYGDGGNDVWLGMYSTAWKTDGAYSYKLEKLANPECVLYTGSYAYNKIFQVFDFTDIDKIKFDYKFLSQSETFRGSVTVAGTEKWYIINSGTGTAEIDVSEWTENRQIEFKLLHDTSDPYCYTTEQHFYIDNIEKVQED